MIASAAGADKNSLSTGTLGWSAIRNRAEYEVEQQSAGLSSGGEQFVGNMANGLLSGLNGSGSASSATQAAVSEGSIIIRDKANQQQDTAGLSRDKENANPGLSPIFDKEREQQRLREAQLISEIGSQAMDIARTQGQLAATSAGKAELEKQGIRAPGKDATQEERAAYNKALTETAGYKTAQAKWGTGSAIQQGMQAATAAVQGLAGGNVGAAIAGAASPYLAEQIHKLTAGNPEAKAMAHAVVGAVVAQASGNSALAGAAGAVSGEVMAQLMMEQLYPGKAVSELTEAEKQTLSALGTLAAGLAGGIAGDSAADAVAGAQTGKNAVENNSLSGLNGFGPGFWNNVQAQGSLVNNTNLTDETGKVLNPATPEEIKYASDKLVTGELPEGANITKAIVDGYKDGVLIAGAWYLGPAASVGKVMAGSAIGAIANGTYQWFDLSQPGNENKTWDYWGSASAAATGALAPGRDILPNVGIAVGGALFTDGPDAGAVGGAAAGAWAGGIFGLYAPGAVGKITGENHIPEFIYDVIGSGGSAVVGGFTKDAINATPGNQPVQGGNKK